MDISRVARFLEMSCHGVEKVIKKADSKFMPFSNSISSSLAEITEATKFDSSSGSLSRLALILGNPLPELPRENIISFARELRKISTTRACNTWVHPGWAEVVQWITKNVPGCDPVVPAIHAVRLAEQVRTNEVSTYRAANYVLSAARRSLRGQNSKDLPLSEDIASIDESRPNPTSLSEEASELFRKNGIVVGNQTWQLVSEGIDIAVDWLDDFSTRNNLTGCSIFSTARDSESLSSKTRLRKYFSGQASKPLVSLLLGGDQWGTLARKSCGNEASLVLWSLGLRRSRQVGDEYQNPPAPVVRAWRTTTELIERVIHVSETNEIELAPTVAA
ncbi:MAG: hypothetical protein HKL80_06595 [Acidimicrobiales bacterium]|nr:hypothetical protein [Acidimicrobiales bacterium]